MSYNECENVRRQKRREENAAEIKKLSRLWQFKETKVKGRVNQYHQYWISQRKKYRQEV